MKNLSFFLEAGKLFFLESFLFLITLLLAISTIEKIPPQYASELSFNLQGISIFSFVFYFFVATIFLVLITYVIKSKRKKQIIFKAIFFFVVLYGNALFMLFWLPPILTLALITLFLFWRLKKPSVLNHNVLMLLAIVGISVNLGSIFLPKFLVFLLIIFSIYDILAVYKTKHMVKIAKEMLLYRTFIGLILPKTLRGFGEELEKVSPGEGFVIIGGGDITFPLLFSLSMFLQNAQFWFFVPLFSLAGFFINFFILFSQKERKPIPALPVISFFLIIGFLISTILQ